MPLNDRNKPRAPRNRTISIDQTESERLTSAIVTVDGGTSIETVRNKIICGDIFQVLPQLAPGSVDLLICDPPYNLDKNFGGERFTRIDGDSYAQWLDSWL